MNTYLKDSWTPRPVQRPKLQEGIQLPRGCRPLHYQSFDNSSSQNVEGEFFVLFPFFLVMVRAEYWKHRITLRYSNRAPTK